MAESWIIGQLLVLALFAGSTACWLLKVDDTLPFTLGSGIAGVYFEPWISLGVGPQLFQHSLLSCLAGAVLVAFLLGILQSVSDTFSHLLR